MSTTDELKSTAEAWGGGNNEVQVEEDSPPAYSGSAPQADEDRPTLPTRPHRSITHRTTGAPYNPIAEISKWANMPFTKYTIPMAVSSPDRTITTTNQATYLTNHQSLLSLLIEQSALPPVPMIRITGAHRDNAAMERIDFDVLCPLNTLIDLRKPPRWLINATQQTAGHRLSSNMDAGYTSSPKDSNSKRLDVVIQRFLSDKSPSKSLTLSRTVANLPEDVMEGYLRNLIAALNYRGKVTISFPIQCGKVVVQKKPASATGILGGWLKTALGQDPETRYEVGCEWCLGRDDTGSTSSTGADLGADDDDVDGDTVMHSSSKYQSDVTTLVKDWWNAWAPSIRNTVILKRRGKVSVDDWIQTQMGWSEKTPTGDWGVTYSS